jgi:hypothetical protein
LCWSFYCVNDNTKIDLENTQIIRCILSNQEPIIGINSRTQARKGLISYYKTNRITSLKKHVNVEHVVIAKMFEGDVNFFLKGKEERQPIKKIKLCLVGQFKKKILSKIPSSKEDVPQKKFEKTWAI